MHIFIVEDSSAYGFVIDLNTFIPFGDIFGWKDYLQTSTYNFN